MPELEEELAALGGPVPLPPGLLERLQAALGALEARTPAVAAATTGAAWPADNPLAGLDAPLALPADAAERIASALVGAEVVELPSNVRDRVVRALAPARPRPGAMRWLGIAAALVLVAGGTAAMVDSLSGQGRPHGLTVAAGPRSTLGTGAGSASSSVAGGFSGSPGATGSGASAGGGGGGVSGGLGAGAATAGPSAAGSSMGGPAASTAGAGTSASTAPPFAFSSNPPPVESVPASAASPPEASATSPPEASAASPPEASATSPPEASSQAGPAPSSPAPPPLRIGVIQGDAEQASGFDAYLRVLDASGGVNGHTLEAVTVPAGSTVPGLIATVNLSGQYVAGAGGTLPGWVQRPMFEGELAPDTVLRGDVFDTAGAIDRQAQVAVDAVFPSASPGAIAVIYSAPTGLFADDVPTALEEALRAREVTPIVVVYDSGQSVAPVQADVAFLSLSAGAAVSWFSHARAGGIHPPKGIIGLADLVEPDVLANLPEGTLVVSPYLLPSGAERDALQQGIGAAPGDAALHGWETAKTLAVAIWSSGGTNPPNLGVAMQDLVGYQDAERPPYAVRRGTESRLPEGVVLRVQAGQFMPVGGFRTDPF